MAQRTAFSRLEEAAQSTVPQQERQLVVFQLARETYGVDIGWVREIIALQAITRLPGAPSFVEGVINLRGHVIPVVDLRKRFGLAAETDPRRTRIMVVEVPPFTLGLVVDSVSEVLRVPESSIESASSVLSGVDMAYILGVVKLESRLIILLNLARLLQPSEVRSLERVEAIVEQGQEPAGSHGASQEPAVAQSGRAASQAPLATA